MKQPAKSLSAIARELGVPRDTLATAKRAGLDIHDEKALAKWFANYQPKGAYRSKHNDQPATPLENITESGGRIDIEALEAALVTAATTNEIRDAKERILAAKELAKLRREARETILLTEARDSMMGVCTRVREAIIRLVNDLPPQLAGLDEARIHDKLFHEVTALLTSMSKDAGAFFKEP